MKSQNFEFSAEVWRVTYMIIEAFIFIYWGLNKQSSVFPKDTLAAKGAVSATFKIKKKYITTIHD